MKFAVVIAFQADTVEQALAMQQYVDSSLVTAPPVPIGHITLHRDTRPPSGSLYGSWETIVTPASSEASSH